MTVEGFFKIADELGWGVAALAVMAFMVVVSSIWACVHIFAAQEGTEISLFYGAIKYTRRSRPYKVPKSRKIRIRPIKDPHQQLILIAYGVANETSMHSGGCYRMLQEAMTQADFEVAREALVKRNYLTAVNSVRYKLTEPGLKWQQENRQKIEQAKQAHHRRRR